MRPDLRLATAILSALALAAEPQPAAPGGGGGPTSGAHTAHLTSGAYANAYACETCHNSVFAVVFPPPSLARSNGASPTFDATSKTCSNVYCHAGGPQLPLPGGTLAVPVFAPPSTVACGACHGVPPPAPHTQSTRCGDCHDGYTATTVNKALHLNGVLNVSSGSCTACHGDAARTATALNPQLPAAPPKDVAGNTATTSPGVGAHQAHLNAGSLRGAMACTECHTVPGDAAHATQPLQLTWGTLATTQGATPSFNATSFTCSSTYCHGSTLNAGGTLTNPVWISGASQVACGSCHAGPPPSPHPQNASCGTCHPGYTATTVNVGTHVNGTVDLSALACTACHGDAARTATTLNPQLPAAPPTDVAGNTATTSPGVGAHQAHLVAGSLRGAMACTECHTVPSDAAHATQPLQLTWGTLATTGGAAPSFNPSNLTCSSTYCHGSTLSGGSLAAPIWNGGSSQVACGSCHGIAPASPHPPVGPSVSCGDCHPGYTRTTVNVALHVNGVPDVSGAACTACHGDAARTATTLNPQLPAAPPKDVAGNTATTSPGVGTHQLHLNDNASRIALACTECHLLPPASPHPNGSVTMTWGPLATALGASPSLIVTNPASPTCSSTYCHGNFQFTATVSSTTYTVSGNKTYSPVFNAPVAQACGTCHGNATIATPAGHPALAASATNATCNVCHPATVKTDGTIDVAGAKHIDGQAQALAAASHPAGWMTPGNANFHAGPAGQGLQACLTCHAATPPATVANVVCSSCHGSTWSSAWVDATSCTMCHGTSGRAGGSAANPVNASPPAGTYGHEADAARIGAHLAHLQATLSATIQCNECHVVPATALSAGHANGPNATVTFGTLAKTGGKTPIWNGASCSASYCHGNFTGGATATPSWTGAAMACTSCHGNPPSTGQHAPRNNNHGFGCNVCHGTGYSSTTVAVATHVNGVKNVAAGDPPGWNSANRTCSNGCHGTKSW
jgi:predicted CxxxxCH...CXXCH cytochrome family protein